MLKRILIDGYKSIDKVELQLERFTLLSGINSAGKSSVIQAILYMLQAGRNSNDMLQVYENLGRFTDIRNNIKANKEILFELDIQDGEETAASWATIEPSLSTSSRKKSEIWENYADRHRTVYLSVERVGIQKTYELNIAEPEKIGRHGEYIYSYLALQGQEPLKEEVFLCQAEVVGKSLNNQVNYWLAYLMGFRIQTNIVQDVDQVVVTYSNSAGNRFYRAANVGTGVTFISMLIIAALSCKRGDTLIIENPEIHLHPRAQSRFMEFMAYLSERGLQIILETHSDHIYNGMRKCIKNNSLSIENIAAYFLQLNDRMQTEACRVRFNAQGAEENHPYGMFDQFDDDLDELLDM